MSSAKDAYILALANDQNAALGVEYATNEANQHRKALEDLATSFLAGMSASVDYLEKEAVHRKALHSAEEALYTRFIVRKQQTAHDLKVAMALLDDDEEEDEYKATVAAMVAALNKEKLWIPSWSKSLAHVHIVYRDDMKEIVNSVFRLDFPKKPKSIVSGDIVVIVSPTRFQLEGIILVNTDGLPFMKYAKCLTTPIPLLELATRCGSTLVWKGFHESNICTVPEHRGYARVYYKADNYEEVLTKFCDLLIQILSDTNEAEVTPPASTDTKSILRAMAPKDAVWQKIVKDYDVIDNVMSILDECRICMDSHRAFFKTMKDPLKWKEFCLRVIHYMKVTGQFGSPAEGFNDFGDTANGCDEVVYENLIYLIEHPEWTP